MCIRKILYENHNQNYGNLLGTHNTNILPLICIVAMAFIAIYLITVSCLKVNYLKIIFFIKFYREKLQTNQKCNVDMLLLLFVTFITLTHTGTTIYGRALMY